MRGRKPTNDDVEIVSTALAAVEDPYSIKDLLKRPTEELGDAFDRESTLGGITALRAGRYAMALKEQLGHGKWLAYIEQRGWNLEYVRGCMKWLEIVVRHPEARDIQSTAVIRRLYHTPIDRVGEILGELSPKQRRQLTTPEFERLDREKKAEDQKSKARPKKKSFGEVVIPADLDLASLVFQAVSALNQISEYPVDPEGAASCKRYFGEIEAAWNRAGYKLNHPAHTGPQPEWRSPSASDFDDSEEADGGK